MKMEKITGILQQYGIYPQAIVPITDRVYKIKAQGKQFELKRSRLDEKSLQQLVTVYETAAKHKLHEVIPVYLTKDKKIFVTEHDGNYYLTPWLEKQHRDEKQVHSIYRQLGRIHVQTKNIFRLESKDWIKNFQNYKKNCEINGNRLLAWVERIEKIHYPSPLELQILTHYRDLRICLHRSQTLVDQILYLSESDANWGVSLTHGNLAFDHLFDHYFINWERSNYKHAIFDLMDLLQQVAIQEPHLRKTFINEFSVYMEENPLNRLEQSVLCLYLLDTEDYLRYVEKYLAKDFRNRSHVDLTVGLERIYRKIVFGLAFDAHLAKIEEKAD